MTAYYNEFDPFAAAMLRNAKAAEVFIQSVMRVID